MICIKRAEEKDAEILHNIKVRAFDQEVKRYYGTCQSLADYRSVETEYELMKQHLVYKVLVNLEIIGGFLLDNFSEGKMKVEDFAIDPEYQGEGYAREVLKLIEEEHPTVKEWLLSALVMNQKSQRIYREAGYEEVKRDEEEVWFRKKMD